MAEISWGLVGALAATAIPMALLSSLVGLRPRLENPLWWSLYAGWIVVIRLVGDATPFRTILFASVLGGLLHGTLSGLLLDRYMQNNPWHRARMEGPKLKLAGMFVVTGLMIGTIFGAVVGGVAWGLERWWS